MTKGAEIPKDRRAKLGFHGTDYDFENTVLPRRALKHSPHFAISGEDDTYFLPADGTPEQNVKNEKAAWGWTTGLSQSPLPSDDMSGRRPRVHITRPIGKQHIDKNLYYADDSLPEGDAVKQWAAVAPAQEIKDTNWGPPASPGTHVNQTLPNINWNQFNAPNWTHTVEATRGHAEYEIKQESPDYVEYLTQVRSRVPGPNHPPAAPEKPKQIYGQQALDINVDPPLPRGAGKLAGPSKPGAAIKASTPAPSRLGEQFMGTPPRRRLHGHL